MKWPLARTMDPIEFILRIARYAIRIGALATLVLSMDLVHRLIIVGHRSPASAQRMAALLQDAPPLSRFFYAHEPALQVFFLSLAVAALGSGLGLQRRKEWARRLMMVLLASIVVWILGVSAIQLLPITEAGGALHLGADRVGVFGGPDRVPFVITMVLLAATTLFFVWIIKRLASAEVRAVLGAR